MNNGVFLGWPPYYVRLNRSPNSRHASRTRNFHGVVSPPRLRTVRESQRDSVPKPRVARNELPGSSSVKPPQPQRGCGQSVPDRGHDLGRNAVGVVSISERAPKVGVDANLGLEVAIPLGLFAVTF